MKKPLMKKPFLGMGVGDSWGQVERAHFTLEFEEQARRQEYPERGGKLFFRCLNHAIGEKKGEISPISAETTTIPKPHPSAYIKRGLRHREMRGPHKRIWKHRSSFPACGYLALSESEEHKT